MQRIVIIGEDSYLATGLIPCFGRNEVQCFAFDTWTKNIDVLRNADYVFNFAIHPNFLRMNLAEDEILDIQLAHALAGSKAQLVFMSSRKVYGTTDVCKIHKEEDETPGFDFYSKNKVKTELALQKILGDNVTILRIANILGEPVARHGYKTFIGWISEGYINDGKLTVNQNEQATKDFITKDFLHNVFVAVTDNNLRGIYNVSSGTGTTVQDVLAGYVGSENLVLQGQNLPKTDQFILDNTKLKQATGLSLSKQEIDKYLAKCHQILDLFRQKEQQR